MSQVCRRAAQLNQGAEKHTAQRGVFSSSSFPIISAADYQVQLHVLNYSSKFFFVSARPNQTPPAPKQLRVRPTFSKYLALNGRGLDVKQAFNPEGEFQRLAAQSGLYESEEL